MGLEDIVDVASDLMGEFSEGIKDAVVDVEEFSRTAIEGIGEQGMEALGNGDLKGAIESSDLSKDSKEIANQLTDSLPSNFAELLKSTAKVIGGTAELGFALATEGIQIEGVRGLINLASGVRDLATQINGMNENKKVAALANA